MATPKHEGILILGTPRSGTTLLRRLLDAHPNIACPGETGLFSACARFLHSDEIAEGVTIGVRTGLSYAGFSEKEVLDRVRELAFSFHREHARRQKKARWAEKTAFDAFHLAEIEALCGDHAFFVCVQRHGLDVACSLVELCDKNGVYLPELHEYIKRYPQPLQAFAHAWVDLTTAIRAFANRRPGNAILIRYEDLVGQPEATLRSILDFIGEEWADGLIRSGVKRKGNLGLGDWKTYGKSSVDTTSVSRWKQLSRSTVSKLGAIVNPLLVECGYEPVPTEGASPGDEVARRRYELGLAVNAIKGEAADTKRK